MARTRGELAAELTAQRLHELYIEQRLSYRAIARQIGCSDHTVAAPVRRLDLERPPTPARPAPDATTVKGNPEAVHRERLDLRALAARTGVPAACTALTGPADRRRRRASRLWMTQICRTHEAS